MHRLLRTNRDIAQVAHRGRSMADRDIANRQLPRVNAIEPVAVMILAFVQMDVGIRERLGSDIAGFVSRALRVT